MMAPWAVAMAALCGALEWRASAMRPNDRPWARNALTAARSEGDATMPRMDLTRFPRRRYTPGPTPLEFLPRFTRALGGPQVWIKRDDLLGLAPGGNKTRKLEFLVADALAQGADTLVTCGAPQSNHCRITLSAAAREGLKCRFVIEERVPGSYDAHGGGNHLMFR